MNITVKLMKNALNELYPGKKFSVRLKRPKSYVFTSDKLIVKSTEVPAHELITALSRITKHVVIGRRGQQLVKGNFFAPMIFADNTWHDMELCDFIEIE